MRDKVLYFPYIDVPQSAWLTRMLLYWDSVGAIIPFDFIEKPERLHEHTRSLVQANLLTQVIPSDYIGDIPNFSHAFLSYLDSLGDVLDRRRLSFQKRPPTGLRRRVFSRRIHSQKMVAVPLHMEKTSSLSTDLIHLGLAAYDEYPWLAVEKKTADEFMYYLATVLGQHRKLQFTPVTDNLRALTMLKSFSTSQRRVDDFNISPSLRATGRHSPCARSAVTGS